MHCLSIFIVVLQELHYLLQCLLLGVFIEKYMYVCTKFHRNWLLCE